MENDAADYLMISGLRHFAYCRRRWALVHIEQQWAENALTMDGHFVHERVHDTEFTEKRGRLLLSRGMSVASKSLGITGQCDMVELEESPDGVNIVGRPGKFLVYPVEYKHGRPDSSHADEWQLCAQAMCLEEMLCTDIPEGAVYYGELHARQAVPLSDELRSNVKSALKEMHELIKRQYTPKVKANKTCSNCSLRDLCHPELLGALSASRYVLKTLTEDGDA